MITFNLEAAQQAARDLIGVGPDPRDYWGEYLTVNAPALAKLLDALNVPHAAVRGAVLNAGSEPAEPGEPATEANDAPA